MTCLERGREMASLVVVTLLILSGVVPCTTSVAR